ncbi:MAG: phosphoribosyl-AMP cyclohydrolase [Candidatus Diapherotrites archaeon]
MNYDFGIDFKKGNGIVPVIVQDWKTNEVLMQAYLNKEAFEKTMNEKRFYYFSRSKNRVKLKGEESGNVQLVKGVFVDCDNDCVLLKVESTVGACHKGYKSCFYRKIEGEKLVVAAEKVFDPKKVYGEKK